MELLERRSFAAVAAVATLVGGMALGGSPARAAPAFGTPSRVGAVFSEPGIDIADDGTVYVNAIRGFPSRSPLWRSTDGGASWTALTFGTPYHRLPGGGDSDIAAGGEGRLYHLDLWVGSNSIASSPDRGETWTGGGPFSTLPLTDRQWITAAGPGTEPGTDRLYIAYQLIQPPSNVMLARSDDGGATWLHHTLPHLPHMNTLPGQVVADGDFVAVSYVSGPQLWVARSQDAGLNWTAERVDLLGDVAPGLFPAAGLSMDGDTIAATWQSTVGNQIQVAVSHDRGGSWSFPVTVSDGETAGAYPWVAVRGDKVAVAWYGADAPGSPSSMPGSTQWFVRYAQSLDGGETFEGPVAAAGPVKAGSICQSGLGCSGDRDLGDFLQIAIHPDGRSMISYADIQFDTQQPGTYVVAQSIL